MVGLERGVVMAGARRLVAAVAVAVVSAAVGVPWPALASSEKVDLNTASLEELTELPGVGPARARAIIERREETPFRTAEDLREVPGIGDSIYDKLRDRIAVSEAGEAKGDASATTSR
jgi:competence protein ComEA